MNEYDETEAAQHAEIEKREIDPQRHVIEQRSALLSDERTVEQLLERRELISDAMKRAMKQDVHYGKIPGINKPTLLKPGAELLCSLFMFDPEYESEHEFVGMTRQGIQHLLVRSRCTIWHTPTGARVASGEGLCSTREKKYAVRRARRVCPECGAENINRSKFADKQTGEKGWYCHKSGGCGAQFDANDPRIVEQEVGEVENPDIADTWNTVVKMANKRALIAAVLNATGASDVFTQDVEPDEVESADVETTSEQRIEHAAQERPVAKSWAEVGARLAKVLGGGEYGVETAEYIIDEVATTFYPPGGLRQLAPGAARTAARQKFANLVLVLESGGDFPPPDREEVQRIVARVFDGIAIKGPPWRMSPDETDRPEHEEVANSEGSPSESESEVS